MVRNTASQNVGTIKPFYSMTVNEQLESLFEEAQSIECACNNLQARPRLSAAIREKLEQAEVIAGELAEMLRAE